MPLVEEHYTYMYTYMYNAQEKKMKPACQYSTNMYTRTYQPCKLCTNIAVTDQVVQSSPAVLYSHATLTTESSNWSKLPSKHINASTTIPKSVLWIYLRVDTHLCTLFSVRQVSCSILIMSKLPHYFVHSILNFIFPSAQI